MRILLAEDTQDLNRAVTVLLTRSGYEVDSVFDGEAALARMEESGYDAAVLDIMMPKLDGLSVLREIRARGIFLPVLLLTAKAEVDDRVAGLSAGADDYLPKPFAMQELLARVNALTRRRTAYSAADLSCGDFSLLSGTMELRAENSIRLSNREFALIHLLAANAERELTESFLLDQVWDREPEATAATVYLYVCYLRRKLRGISSRAVIEGEKGGSYRLRPFRPEKEKP